LIRLARQGLLDKPEDLWIFIWQKRDDDENVVDRVDMSGERSVTSLRSRLFGLFYL
jgi:hypothetical protein